MYLMKSLKSQWFQWNQIISKSRTGLSVELLSHNHTTLNWFMRYCIEVCGCYYSEVAWEYIHAVYVVSYFILRLCNKQILLR